MSQAIELHTLFTFRCFCLVQKKKGVAGAVIEAQTSLCILPSISSGGCTASLFYLAIAQLYQTPTVKRVTLSKPEKTLDTDLHTPLYVISGNGYGSVTV